MIVISIDPGLRACGVAIWRESLEPYTNGCDGARLVYRLLAAAHVKSKSQARDAQAWIAMSDAVGSYVENYAAPYAFEEFSLVIEFPQTYGGRSAKGDTNDLLQLSAVVGAICQDFSRYQGLNLSVWKPSEWKGNVPKEATAARALAKLTEEEYKQIDWPAASLKHNVSDAIAIGQKYFETRPISR